jgi:hypothetical protein
VFLIWAGTLIDQQPYMIKEIEKQHSKANAAACYYGALLYVLSLAASTCYIQHHNSKGRHGARYDAVSQEFGHHTGWEGEAHEAHEREEIRAGSRLQPLPGTGTGPPRGGGTAAGDVGGHVELVTSSRESSTERPVIPAYSRAY